MGTFTQTSIIKHGPVQFLEVITMLLMVIDTDHTYTFKDKGTKRNKTSKHWLHPRTNLVVITYWDSRRALVGNTRGRVDLIFTSAFQLEHIWRAGCDGRTWWWRRQRWRLFGKGNSSQGVTATSITLAGINWRYDRFGSLLFRTHRCTRMRMLYQTRRWVTVVMRWVNGDAHWSPGHLVVSRWAVGTYKTLPSRLLFDEHFQ